MRKKIVAGNWKMNKNREEAASLVKKLIHLLSDQYNVKCDQVILAPPFPFLSDVCDLTKNKAKIKIAAQNCHSEEKGAFTGEVSATMIKSVGAEYVIIGHSERRAYFAESNDFLAKKVNAVLKCGLFPIFCCGETLPEREKGNHFNVVKQQLQESVFGLSELDFQNVIVAYEPVWAIGTGVTATADQAQEMHAAIRNYIAERYNPALAENITILYGGSCNAKNAKELFANTDVDGGLIGGASLIEADFAAIVNAF